MPRHSTKQLQKVSSKRRGATLVLVAILMTVLFGITALAVDFSRMYSFKAELKRLTDAAALSGTLDVMNGGNFTTVKNGVANLRANNKIEVDSFAEILDADITAVYWNFTNGTASSRNFGDPDVNGVRIAGRYSTRWTLARFFGANVRTINDTSVAAFGYVASGSCIKPWGIPYGKVLLEVGEAATNTGYSLDEFDFAELAANNSVIGFKDPPSSNAPAATDVSGAFGWVDPDETSGGGNKNQEIANAIVGCAAKTIAVGSQIAGVTGNRSASVIQDAITTLCGGPSVCVEQPPVLVPIYDLSSGSGNNAKYRIKYIGAFKLLGQGTDCSVFASAGGGSQPVVASEGMDEQPSYFRNASYEPYALVQKDKDKDNDPTGKMNLCGRLTSVSVPPTGGLTNAVGPVKAIAIVR